MFLLTYYELPSIALLSKKKHLSPSDLKRKKFIDIFTLIEKKKNMLLGLICLRCCREIYGNML